MIKDRLDIISSCRVDAKWFNDSCLKKKHNVGKKLLIPTDRRTKDI